MSDQKSHKHPHRIGPYHIVQVIGEGGMGVVYEAEQKEPVRRRVAIKTMKVGMDTKEVVGRFEAERQALAVMDHPGIAKVFDAGATEEGRPYFVMELVHGVRIDEYCDRHRLTTRQRAELFTKVCDAVQHAHQKGVIHRDLKPSNVLVSEERDLVLPKIIDFGVAKATGQRLTKRTVVTTYGQAVGTLAYMSPEQAEMSGLDVDTRADIYSLGVILYELLLGVVPLDPMEVGPPVFLARLIERDTPSPSPTRRLTSLSEDRREIVARHRHTDPETLRRELESDLQWIVLKAMEKERVRRYETASELAADLRRYLTDEPVLAHPPSTGYRVRKFVRRNRPVVAMAAALASLTVVYAVSMAIQVERVAAERDRAELEAQTAQRVSDFMARIFSVSDPSEARGRSITALEILERGRERIDDELADEPLVQSRLMTVMGQVYMGLGLYDEAEKIILGGLDAAERASGPADPRVVASLNQLAWLYRSQRRYDDALPLAKRATEIAEGSWGTDDARYAAVLQTLGMIQRDRSAFGAAREALERSFEIRREQLGPDHADVGWTLYHLGWLTYLEGDVHGARAAYERAIPILEGALDPDDPRLSWGYNDMAVVLGDLGEHEEALQMQRRIVELRERTQGPRHPDVAAAINNLANTLSDMGELERALEHRHRALEIRREAFGPEHTMVASSLSDIGLTLQEMGRYEEALERYEQAIRTHEAATGPDDPDLRRVLNNLGYLLRYVGRLEAARPHLERSLRLGETTLGPDHIDNAPALTNLGFLARDQERYDEATRYMERAYDITAETFGEDHVEMFATSLHLGSTLNDAGKHERSLAVLERGQKILEAQDDADGSLRTALLFELGRAREGTGDAADAATTYQRLLEVSRATDGEESGAYAGWQMRAAVQAGDLDRAVTWLERAVARGFRDPAMFRNPQLAPLRERPEFERLTREIREAAEVEVGREPGGS